MPSIGTRSYAESEKPLIDFKMPSFEISYGSRMDDVLVKLGFNSMYDPNIADFTGMYNVTDNEKVPIGSVKHRATITVDRNGTEAAAATYISRDGSSSEPIEKPAPIEFHANRPFGFVIFEKKAGTIIFLGTKVL